MLEKLAINAAILTAICLAGTVYLSKKVDTLPPEPVIEAPKNTKPLTRKPALQQSASVVSIPKNAQTGQYHTTARVNSAYIDFLVDTGASAIALTLEDARKAGVPVRDLTYNIPVSTAGGTNYAARTRLPRVSVGTITLTEVDALILKDGLSTSLLGMSFLGRLQKIEATQTSLILRQ